MVNVTVLQWALYTSIGLISFIVLIILYLVLKRWYQRRREQYIEQYFKRYLNVWHDYLINGNESVTLTTGHRKDYNHFLAIDRIFSHYVMTVHNDDVKERISRFAEVHFKKEYSDMLHSHNWGIRMNALYRIFHFNLTFLTSDVRLLLQNKRYKNAEEYALMLKILARVDEQLVISHLLKPRLELNEYYYKQIVFYLPETFYKQLITHFDVMPYTLKISLLEYFTYKPSMDKQFLMFYEQQLQQDNPELRIRALKAVAKFGLISDISLYEPFKQSDHWEERMLYTRIVPKAERQYAIEQLRLLINDSSWWVRKGAAYSLFHLKNGPAILQQIIEEEHDRYAVQAAQEMLKVE